MLRRIDSEAIEIDRLKAIFENLNKETGGDGEGGDGEAEQHQAKEINLKHEELASLSEQVATCEGRHAEISGEIREIQLQIPSLEGEKANAAKSRNFKVAASVSKDLISKKERLTDCEKLLSEDIEVELNNLRVAEKGVKNDLAGLEEAASENNKKR